MQHGVRDESAAAGVWKKDTHMGFGKRFDRVTLDGEKLGDTDPQWPQRCAACGKTCAERMNIASVMVSSQALSEFFPTRKFSLPMHAFCRHRFLFHWYADKFSTYLIPLTLVVAGVFVYRAMHAASWSHDMAVTVFLAVFLAAAVVSMLIGVMTRPAVYIEETPLNSNGLRRKGEHFLYDFLFRDAQYGGEFRRLNPDAIVEPPPRARRRIS